MKYFYYALLFPFFSIGVFAHPHAFVDLKTQALIENQTLKGFRMSWTLDEIASSTLIYEMQSSADPVKAKQDLTKEMIDLLVSDLCPNLRHKVSRYHPLSVAPL